MAKELKGVEITHVEGPECDAIQASTWPAWGTSTGDQWKCAVVLESGPEPATDQYEMEAE